jgi:nicotinamidase-related amidase
MTKYHSSNTGLLLVDPYNDFLDTNGKLWPFTEKVSQSVNLLSHLREIMDATRQVGIKIFFVPHHRWEAGEFNNWKHPTPYQIKVSNQQMFAKGSWGGEFHPDFEPQESDIIIKEHWGQSGFANTDLDYQLKMHGIEKIILIGMLANTCIESTARFGMELGYHVTLVKDATSAFNPEMMHAAHELNGPTYAHEILTTKELISAFF